MSEPISPEMPRRLLSDLCRLTAERAAVESEVDAARAARDRKTENEYRTSRKALDERYAVDKKSAEEEYASRRAAILQKFEAEHTAAQTEYAAAREDAAEKFAAEQQAAEQSHQDSHWEAMEASDAARGGLNLPMKDILAALDDRWRQLEEIHKQAVAILERRGHWDELPPDQPTAVILEKQPGRRFCHALEQVQLQFNALSKQFLPKLFQGIRPLGLFCVIWALAACPTLAFFKWNDWRMAAVSGGAALIVSVIAGTWVHHVAKRKSFQGYLALRHTLLEAGLAHPGILESAKAECQKLDASIIARHKTKTYQADETHKIALEQTEKRKQKEFDRIEATYPKRLAELTAWRDRSMKEIEEKFPPLLRQIEDNFRVESRWIEERHKRELTESHESHEKQRKEMADRWLSGMSRFEASVADLEREARQNFPDWNTDDWSRWTTAASIPSVIPLGYTSIKLSDLKNGLPRDERLRPSKTDFTLPIYLPYPRRSLLMLKAAGPGLGRAVDLMQTAMLRMLTAMPPSKVRFTIIDPVGLGDNFSAFMHLADFDEQLVASRIWTDTSHIEQRLADLTKHMENVIQVYLRKEFHSIEEYNAFAGEMAEPYRVLVVANFPANFSESAAHRIKSIAASGARCGVFVMMSVDTNMPMPRNVQMPDVEADALMLRWAEGRFLHDHPDFGPLGVAFDQPPPPERTKEILRIIGTEAKNSGRVEVPFSHIVPQENEWWTADSRTGIDVPLGRAGAMKLQHLDLGAGTSQHVLISGKTGSGKSTLLHVLITNIALRYSPDEIELYLVDFKKGVEFKAYARSGLPHARVVAIESEREFGLSVLERLDAELRTRGDRYRKLGVQDLKGFRAAEPNVRMPRILLIIDEFQELFVEDDRIAQESALLLDRLVRQGRAFGIHILLGSQTLGGAYTLARSTIGQMAVRIALQCSESDAHLILSEDNTAARLLTRPGEAIYNDANGLYEGNHPFQVVWLADSERDEYLNHVADLSRSRKCTLPPSIVFEGNVLADPRDNPLLSDLLAADSWPAPAPAVSAWLGSAVAIKDPTAMTFMRQNGSNLLIVGHREEAALGLMASCFMSLAAQISPLPKGEGTIATFYILDGIRADAPEVGFWNRLAQIAPQGVKIADVRGSNDLIAEIAAELSARREQGHESGPPIYLFVYNLGRFRDLKKEDDFSFSADDKATSPAKQFAMILREGPPLGIHCLVWCDTYSNVNRMLDRQSLRDFEMRVLFQMNANDSSSLMDTPEAARLGVHRALLYDEGQGRMEKFRPYGLPSDEWLASVKKQLRKKA